MASLFDVFGRLLLDDKEFQKDAAASGDKAGQTVGTRFSSKMTTLAKGAIGGVIGGGLATGFSIAAKGAAELDSATQQLVADTGLSGEAADQAKDQLAGLYKDNLQGFDQIGAALAKVHTDLGLTGDAAGEVTGEFLKFSTATGQDASDAVANFDDILDGFNLTGDRSKDVMDLLIASHQKYGGSIQENEKTLADLAPALTAANLGFEDGVGLLNLFATAGVDAATAPAALSKALGKIKSPQELQQLLTEISQIQDPFARAARASEIFGAKAGPKLALALSKGNVADFTISLQDAQGATDDASAAVESSFGNRFQLLMKQAGGTLAEFGSNFGPLVLGFSSLLPAITPVITTAGAAAGGLLAAAIPIGMAALPVIIIGAIVAAIAVLIASPEIRKTVFDFVGGLLGWLRDALGKLPQLLLDVFMAAVGLVAQALPGLVSNLADIFLSLPGAIASLAVDLVATFADIGVKILGGVAQLVANIIGGFADMFGAIIGQAVDFAGQLLAGVAQLAVDIVGTILSIPGRVVQWYLSIIVQGATLARQVLGLIVGLARNVVAQVLSIPGRIVSWVTSIVGQAGKLVAGVIANVVRGAGIVVSTVLGIPGRIVSWVGSIVGQAGRIAGQLVGIFTRMVGNIVGFFLSIPGRIASLGGQIVSSIIRGLSSLPGKLAGAIGNAIRGINVNIGPFHIRGGKITVDFPDISGFIPHLAGGGDLVAGQAAVVGEHGRELFVPSVPGTVIPHQAIGAATAAGGGDTYNISVPVHATPAAQTPSEIVRELRVASKLGLIGRTAVLVPDPSMVG